MSYQTEALTTATLSLALEAAARRHQAIAANIANANTEGYTPVKLSFEAHLAEARNALRAHGSVDPLSLSGAHMELEPVLDAQGLPAAVRVDAEVAEMAANAVHYQALTQGLSRHLAILATAAGDGRK
jgi:flagellar basal-body rod protein FlgB